MTAFLTATLPLSQLSESPLNYRTFFDEKKLAELAESIKLVGIKAPLLVRAIKNGAPWLDPSADLLQADGYEIASGHRRFRASKLAGLDQVPVIIQSMTDDAFIELLSVEIVQHEGVHPLDEAKAFRNLLKRPGYDPDVIAARIGKDRLYVQRRLSLLRMTDEAQTAFMANDGVNLAMALILSRLTPADQKLALARLWDKESWKQIKSSRALQEFVDEELTMSLKKAPFDPEDPNLVRGAGTCGECEKRVGFMPELFPETTDHDTCTDRECFNKKKSAAIATIIYQFSLEHGFKPILVSSEYGSKLEPFAGLPVIGRRSYEEASKKKKCEFQKAAIVVRGDEGVGKQIEVCTNPKCKVHKGRYTFEANATPKQIAERDKREFEQKVDERTRRELLHAIIAAYERDPDMSARRDDLRLLAKKAFEGVRDQEYRKEMLLARGVDDAEGMAAWIAKAMPLALKSLTLESILSRELDYYYGVDGEEDLDDPDELMRAAKRWHIDVKAVGKETEKALREKQKADADRAAAALKKKEEKAAKANKKSSARAAAVEEA